MQRRDVLKGIAVMLGGSISAPTLMAMDRRVGVVKIISPSENFILTDKQRNIVSEVAEMIIPRTATPGAKDANVPAFIEMMLRDCYRQPEHVSFVQGLKDLDEANFLAQNTSQKTETLNTVQEKSKELLKVYQLQQTKIGDNEDQETAKAQAKGLPFWRLMKELTLLGYFTSEQGLKASFEYAPVPGKLELVKLLPGQKAYAY
jgi:hypothetical protein